MSKRLNRSQKKRWTLFNNKREKSTYTKIPKDLSTSSSHDYVLTNQEEMDILSRFILDYKNIETGGQLFGYWTFDGKPVVLYVLGPGPMAGHHSAFFMQDLDYLRKCARILNVNDNVKVYQKIIQKYTISTECCKGTKSLLYITCC